MADMDDVRLLDFLFVFSIVVIETLTLILLWRILRWFSQYLTLKSRTG